MDTVTFSFPTTIRFGIGVRRRLPEELTTLGIRRPLVVTDQGVAGLDFFAGIVEAAGSVGQAAAFDGVWGNPVSSQVAAGVTAYRAHGADGIVAVGGGAAVDVAKAIALMATHPGQLFDYEDEVPGALAVTDATAPIVALPTTAGTGSEVGRSAVISDDDSHVKRIVFGPPLLPRVVLADPELTVGLPAGITAATGMDALTHNVEAYLARNFHPMCDGIALEGLRLVAGNLARAVAAPGDLDARGAMLMGSMMGAVAFQKGLGVVHSCAHALGTVADVHHGLANAVMIDLALELNVEAAPERFAVLAATVGAVSVDGTPDAAGFLRWLGDLKAEVGIPADLAALGVDPGCASELVAVAVADACHANNPRPVTAGDFEAVFRRSFG
jgi:alcohol dehydrogenase class IV